jgi:hypothetical protein
MSRFSPPPPPERLAEVEASLCAKLERFAEEARRRAAVENTPSRLAEQLRRLGWEVSEPKVSDSSEVRSLRTG